MIDRLYLFIPPQAQGGIGLMKSLVLFGRNFAVYKGFVKILMI